MHSIKSLKNLKNKRVLVRVDYNVSLKNGKIVDPARILASVPTIEYLLKAGAQVILLAHLGRPNGKVVPELSLQPMAKYLAKILGRSVKFVPYKENLLPGLRQGLHRRQDFGGQVGGQAKKNHCIQYRRIFAQPSTLTLR